MNFKIIIVECLPDFISIPQPDRVSYGLFSDYIHLGVSIGEGSRWREPSPMVIIGNVKQPSLVVKSDRHSDLDLLDEEYLENEAVFPDTSELLKTSEFYHYLGPAGDSLYNNRWKIVKSS